MLRRAIVASVAAAIAAGAAPATAEEPDREPVRTLPPPGVEVGEASLERGPNGGSFTFSTTGLQKGHVYTIWFVVFNDPGNCVDGCNAQEIMDPALRDATRAGSLYGAGHVAGGGGTATLSGHRQIGEPADPELGEVGYPLLDPEGAEIHLVLRSHGQRIPGMTNHQLNSFNGGCNPGEPNEGQCANVQFSVFPV